MIQGILDELCSVCGYNRKYAVRILNHPPSGSLKKLISSIPVPALSHINSF